MSQGVDTDADVSLGGQVAWPGTVFDSTLVPDNKEWYQAIYIPFQPRPAGVGTLAQNTMRGIYQVDVYGPTAGSQTEQDVINYLEGVCAAFKRGVSYVSVPVLPGGPQACVTCTQSWIFRSTRDTLTARWVVSARVTWDAHLDN